MIRRHAAGFRALLMFADVLIAVVLLISLSVLRLGPDWGAQWVEVVRVPEAFLVLYALAWVTILTANGLYRPRARWSLRSEARDIVRATVVMALLTMSVLFVFKLLDVSRLLLVILFPLQALLTLGSRAVLRGALERRRLEGKNLRYVLVLGSGPRGQAFAAKLEDHRELGLRIVGFLDESDEFDLPPRWKRLGGLDRIEAILHDEVVDEVAICLPFSQWELIDPIAHLCEAEGKIVRIPMDVLDRTISAGKIEDLDGTAVYSLVSGPDRALALAVKRLIDIGVAAVGLVLVSPILLVAALAIVLEDGSPVLFRQMRVGVHGRPFQVMKLRSMRRSAEAELAELQAQNEINGHAFKVSNDPRVTRVGRFIRRLSIDELPQFWNVLSGEMSLVGPRPPLPSEVQGYDLWHRRRLSMKPGITGLWQVRGRREAEFDRWVESDLEYIDRWSLWLDVKILFRTIPAAVQGR